MADLNLTGAEAHRMERAEALVLAQIAVADRLIRHAGLNGPEVYGAILTALATNYATIANQ